MPRKAPDVLRKFVFGRAKRRTKYEHIPHMKWHKASLTLKVAFMNGAVLLLCSEEGRYITGSEIIADGGIHL